MCVIKKPSHSQNLSTYTDRVSPSNSPKFLNKYSEQAELNFFLRIIARNIENFKAGYKSTAHSYYLTSVGADPQQEPHELL